MRILFALFIIVPILEMLILIKVGSIIGVVPTVGLVLLTAVIGITLLKHQGFDTLNRLQHRLNNGEIPGTELVEGAMLLVGGALLLTPGFFTDAIGFICLIPLFRKPIANMIIRQGVLTSINTFGSRASFHYSSGANDRTDDALGPEIGSTRPGTIIDGEFKEEDEKT